VRGGVGGGKGEMVINYKITSEICFLLFNQ